jgi:uncharacterized protein (DUF1810 family)
MDDPYDLQRFVAAQRTHYDAAREELRQGRKRSHWMWFIFPQIAGLGASAMSQKYAIASRDEATAYLAHAVLGPRLRECTQLVNAVQGRSALQIFGSPDDVKFRSSMTTPDNAVFRVALDKYFAGEADPATIERL